MSFRKTINCNRSNRLMARIVSNKVSDSQGQCLTYTWSRRLFGVLNGRVSKKNSFSSRLSASRLCRNNTIKFSWNEWIWIYGKNEKEFGAGISHWIWWLGNQLVKLSNRVSVPGEDSRLVCSPKRQDLLWCPSSLLFHGCRVLFSRDKITEAWS
jgi:hypothetical protein